MITTERLAGFLACSLCATVALGQMGFGGGFSGPLGSASPNLDSTEIAQPDSRTAQMVLAALDSEVELGEVKTELGALTEVLTEKLQLPVFADSRAIQIATLSMDEMIEANPPKLPLRSALRKLLQPYSLRAMVEQEGLVITADFAELTRQGISTDQWVNHASETEERIHAALDDEQTVDFVEVPLEEAVEFLGEASSVPFFVDQRALEEIGLSPDTPVSIRLNNTTLRSVLRLMLRDLDLTYLIKDDVMHITTVEAAEQNLVGRIYFLEGTGFPLGEFNSVIETIQAAIVPDTWEALGGPSTIVPLSKGNRNRPAIVVSTTSDVHDQISALFSAIRRTQVGPDPVAKAPEKTTSEATQQGGFF